MIMLEVTRAFEEAERRREGWNAAMVKSALRHVGDMVPGARVSWEEGGEEWGTVHTLDRGVALVCARVPLGILSWPDLRSDALPSNMEWVRIESSHVASLAVDKGTLERIFGLSLSSAVDYLALSAQELYWATV